MPIPICVRTASLGQVQVIPLIQGVDWALASAQELGPKGMAEVKFHCEFGVSGFFPEQFHGLL